MTIDSFVCDHKKTLLAAAGTPRPFTPTTGAERTFTPSARLTLLANLLTNLGLPTPISTSTNGGLPSLAKCTEVGERRALEKEMKVRFDYYDGSGKFLFSC